MSYLGDFPEDFTSVPITFTTHAASGAVVAPSTGFEVADVAIFKNGSATEKTTTNGLTMTSAFNGTTGLHCLVIDTSNDTGDGGFWVAGAHYTVVLVPDETVDSLAVVKVIGTFGIALAPVFARVGAPAGASISADVAAVKSDTGSIKTKTDSLTFTVPGMVDSNVEDWKGATAPAMTGDAYASIGAAGAGLTALGDTRIAHLDSDVSSRMATFSYTAPPSASTIAQAVWDALTSALTTVGSIGKFLVTNVDAAVSSRSSHSAADVWAVGTRILTAGTNIALAKGTGVTGFNDLDAASVRGSVGMAAANLDIQIGTLATPTNITAGTITTVTNLTNAPTSGDLTATMKASVTTAATAATPTASAVTGNVGGNVTGTIGGLTAAALKDFFDTDTATTYASAVSGSVVKEIADNAAGSGGPTAADIADEVETRTIAAVTIVNGLAAGVITATSIAADAITDAKVASDVTIASVTGAVGSVAGSVGSVTGNVGGNVVGSVGSVTGLTASNLDATVSSRLATSGYTAPLSAAGTRTAVGLASANLDTQLDALPTNAELSTALGMADDAVLAAVGSLSIPTAAQNADALLDRADAIETGLTPRQAMRLSAAADGGKLSGGATTTNTIRNAVADDKDRIVATVDADGNRTAITYDLS
jgi:hypothetical protein